MRAKRAVTTRVVASVMLLPFVGTVATGQECEDGSEGGYYYNLNWHRTIRLGTAPFFDAELASRAKVAYSYDLNAISSSEAGQLYRDGMLVPAGLGGDGEFWVPPRSADDDLARTVEVLRRRCQTVVYLGEREELNGSVGNPVVSWAPIPWQLETEGERTDAHP